MAKKTISFQVTDLGMVVAGTQKHAKALPTAASKHAKDIDGLRKEIEKHNQEQEQLKNALQAKTKEIQTKLRQARSARLKIIRLAEGTFGHNAPELGDFRSKGEG